ncbi:MAG: MFS transporter [Solirubrobacterales bacterium]
MLVLGVMDFSLEQAIIIPALPAIGAEYSASLTSVTWVITGFLVAAAVATPLAGRLGDHLGKRLVILASLVLFAVGSVLCVVAGSIGLVIAGRVLQGLGAGVGPLATALARDLVPRDQVPRAVGLLIGAGGLGGTIGLLVAGPLADDVSVQSIFWVLAGVAVLLAVAVAALVPDSGVRARARVDWLGAGLLAGLLGTLMLAISQGNEWGWSSARVLGLFGASLTFALAFLARERTAREPLVDPRALSARPVWSAQVTVFTVGVALFVAYALVPQIGGLPVETGYGLGLTTTEIALVLTPGALAALAGGIAGGRLVAAVGARNQAVLGVALAALAYLGFIAFTETVAVTTLALIPLGFGTGLALTAIVDLIVLSVPAAETGVAMGINSVTRAVGAAIGAAVAVAIVTGAAQLAPGVPEAGGFTAAFVMAFVATLIALASLALMPRRSGDPVLAMARPARV